ncbi:hypothetical protein D6821_00090 [Candidatus Parcubacteria bacterium]|nr:MAG: hypothetical protein D6821_00090 [Candidatus Parcubacteria bacterium]
MSEIINLKQPQLPPKPASSRFRWGREVVVVLVALSITVGGLKAADNFWRKQEEEPKACPKEMVFVPSAEGGFCIDKFEASPAPTCPFASPDNQAQTRENLNHPACRPISRAGLVPWRFISQNQAAAACAKAGKRVPTNKEWLQA